VTGLPTLPGGERGESNNYADNSFLQQAVALGYKGAYYSWWRDRDRILAEANAGVVTA
jgi:hypothetical protein